MRRFRPCPECDSASITGASSIGPDAEPCGFPKRRDFFRTADAVAVVTGMGAIGTPGRSESASKGAPDSFNELSGHPGNAFWLQAQPGNTLYQMLDGKQRDQALLPTAPYEDRVGFRGAGAKLPWIPIGERSPDQKEHAQAILKTLLDPYRTTDRDEEVQCLDTQGGLDACHLAFHRDEDVGQDKVWDIWRFEGPSFVWHFRGSPHVHDWVNVADDPSVALNASG